MRVAFSFWSCSYLTLVSDRERGGWKINDIILSIFDMGMSHLEPLIPWSWGFPWALSLCLRVASIQKYAIGTDEWFHPIAFKEIGRRMIRILCYILRGLLNTSWAPLILLHWSSTPPRLVLNQICQSLYRRLFHQALSLLSLTLAQGNHAWLWARNRDDLWFGVANWVRQLCDLDWRLII